MKTSSKNIGKKAVSIFATAALASTMFALPAFAEDPVVSPAVGGSNTVTGDESAQSSSTFYLIDNSSANKTISVTAPMSVYLAYGDSIGHQKYDQNRATDTEGNEIPYNPSDPAFADNAKYTISADDYTHDFICPTAEVMAIKNLTQKWPVQVDSWEASKSGQTIVNNAIAAKDSADKFKETALAANADTYYLTAQVNGGTAYDLAVNSDSTDATNKYEAGAWTIAKNGEEGSTINLNLAGKIFNPTKTKYTNSSQIDKVIWKFSIPKTATN